MAQRQDTSQLHDHRIDFLLSQVGELKGTTSAMNQSLAQLTSNLAGMQADVNNKHQENLHFLQDHTKEDDRRFDKINRIIYMAMGAVAIMEILLRFFLK